MCDEAHYLAQSSMATQLKCETPKAILYNMTLKLIESISTMRFLWRTPTYVLCGSLFSPPPWDLPCTGRAVKNGTVRI